MIFKRARYLMAAVLILFSAGSALGDEITMEGLLDEMVDLERLARAFPDGSRMVQFSSYDRGSKIKDGETIYWHANVDLGQYLRGEKTARGYEYVMAEAEGPGALVRLWSANPGGRTWRVYIDGSEEPVIEAKGKELLGGKIDPWGPAYSGRRAMGGNFIFPVPFSKSIKVTVSHRHGQKGSRAPLMYYHVDLRLYPEGTRVVPFTMAGLEAARPKIEETASRLDDPSFTEGPEDLEERVDLSLAPGVSGELISLEGPGAIRLLEIEISGGDRDLAKALGQTALHIRWDGEDQPSVRVPLGDFFGSSPGAPEMRSLPADITPTPDGARLTSRWVMPFQSSARITLDNRSDVSLNLTARVVHSPRAWRGDSMYFHADWREVNALKTRPISDMRMLEAKGKGSFVGLQMNVRNPMELFWWGEGDEKIWVDGDEFPSIFGTGTEDYFGYAWCVQYMKFTHAYHGVSLPTKEPLAIYQALPIPFFYEAVSRATAKKAVVSQYRWHVLDVIPFDERVVFDMEISHHRPTLLDVNATVYWYAAPGSSDDGEDEDLGSREVWTP